MMAKNIRLGIKRLKEELNSEAFFSGLEAVINYSLSTGNEATFEILYCPKMGVFGYPDYIKLGNNNSVSGFSKTRKGIKMLERAGLIKDMDKFMAKHLEYPLTEDFLKKREIAESIDSECVEAIFVHTHPGKRIVCPSEADLACLNDQRNTQRSLHLTKSNPLEIIVPTIKSIRGYMILMLQENSNVPFPPDTDFKELADEFYELEFNPKNLLFAVIPPGKYPPIYAVEKKYNISHNYLSGNRWDGGLSLYRFLPIVK